jgi:hypothetical protein
MKRSRRELLGRFFQSEDRVGAWNIMDKVLVLSEDDTGSGLTVGLRRSRANTPALDLLCKSTLPATEHRFPCPEAPGPGKNTSPPQGEAPCIDPRIDLPTWSPLLLARHFFRGRGVSIHPNGENHSTIIRMSAANSQLKIIVLDHESRPSRGTSAYPGQCADPPGPAHLPLATALDAAISNLNHSGFATEKGAVY